MASDWSVKIWEYSSKIRMESGPASKSMTTTEIEAEAAARIRANAELIERD